MRSRLASHRHWEDWPRLCVSPPSWTTSDPTSWQAFSSEKWIKDFFSGKQRFDMFQDGTQKSKIAKQKLKIALQFSWTGLMNVFWNSLEIIQERLRSWNLWKPWRCHREINSHMAALLNIKLHIWNGFISVLYRRLYGWPKVFWERGSERLRHELSCTSCNDPVACLVMYIFGHVQWFVFWVRDPTNLKNKLPWYESTVILWFLILWDGSATEHKASSLI